jgi:hypothetical protein
LRGTLSPVTEKRRINRMRHSAKFDEFFTRMWDPGAAQNAKLPAAKKLGKSLRHFNPPPRPQRAKKAQGSHPLGY